MMILGMLTYALSLMISENSNPLKISVSVLSTAMILLFLSYLGTCNSLLSLTLSLLFAGGILMMFMILSSLSPNDPSKFVSQSTLSLLIMMVFLKTMMLYKDGGLTNIVASKVLMTVSQNLYFIMAVMLIYFTGFLSIITHSSKPMRTYN